MNHPESCITPSNTRFTAKTLSYHPLAFKEMEKETPEDHREAFLASLSSNAMGLTPC